MVAALALREADGGGLLLAKIRPLDDRIAFRARQRGGPHFPHIVLILCPFVFAYAQNALQKVRPTPKKKRALRL